MNLRDLVVLQGTAYEGNMKRTYYRAQVLSEIDPPRDIMGIEIQQPIAAIFRPDSPANSSHQLQDTLIRLFSFNLKRLRQMIEEQFGPGEWVGMDLGGACGGRSR